MQISIDGRFTYHMQLCELCQDLDGIQLQLGAHTEQLSSEASAAVCDAVRRKCQTALECFETDTEQDAQLLAALPASGSRDELHQELAVSYRLYRKQLLHRVTSALCVQHGIEALGLNSLMYV